MELSTKQFPCCPRARPMVSPMLCLILRASHLPIPPALRVPEPRRLGRQVPITWPPGVAFVSATSRQDGQSIPRRQSLSW